MTLAAYDPYYIPSEAMWFVAGSLLWLTNPFLLIIAAVLFGCVWVTHGGFNG